jgi:hypothetical protein
MDNGWVLVGIELARVGQKKIIKDHIYAKIVGISE